MNNMDYVMGAKAQASGEILVMLDVRKENLKLWNHIFSNGFQKEFRCEGEPNFADIALFDDLLMKVEAFEENPEVSWNIELSLPQLQRVHDVTRSMIQQGDANRDLIGAAEAFEKVLKQFSHLYHAQVEATGEPLCEAG